MPVGPKDGEFSNMTIFGEGHSLAVNDTGLGTSKIRNKQYFSQYETNYGAEQRGSMHDFIFQKFPISGEG